jgi:hypothetical protein
VLKKGDFVHWLDEALAVDQTGSRLNRSWPWHVQRGSSVEALDLPMPLGSASWSSFDHGQVAVLPTAKNEPIESVLNA